MNSYQITFFGYECFLQLIFSSICFSPAFFLYVAAACYTRPDEQSTKYEDRGVQPCTCCRLVANGTLGLFQRAYVEYELLLAFRCQFACLYFLSAVLSTNEYFVTYFYSVLPGSFFPSHSSTNHQQVPELDRCPLPISRRRLYL